MLKIRIRGTPASVTKKECKCGYLERCSIDPDLPVVYDKRTNEFHIEYGRAAKRGKGYLMIYHCMWCGGLAPRSVRDRLFQVIPHAEEQRLVKLTRHVKSIEDAFKVLGKPDKDGDMMVSTPEKDGKPPCTEAFRQLQYYHLSPNAQIFVTEKPDKSVSIYFYGKGITNKKQK